MFITKRKHQKLLDTLRLEMVTELEGTKKELEKTKTMLKDPEDKLMEKLKTTGVVCSGCKHAYYTRGFVGVSHFICKLEAQKLCSNYTATAVVNNTECKD